MLNIIYTGGMKGELEPCGCSPKVESGGIARIAGYVSGHRKELEPYLILDAGNSMGADTPQGRLKSDALLKSFDIAGYDAVALLKPDLVPADFLTPVTGKYGTQAISDSARYRSAIELERGPLRINVSADPSGRKKGMLNVLLTGRPVSEARLLGGWDVIITSSGEALEGPARAGKTIIVSGYPKGKKLGVLSISLDGRGRVSGFSNRWQELGKDIPEDGKVRDVLKAYDSAVASLDVQGKPSSNGPYLGYSSCAACHQPFVESWLKTRHAGAFGALEKAGKSRDPECVRCHTVGFGEEGGFYSASSTPGLENVQCEVCHGPGKEHAADFARPMRTVGEETCLRCHTKDHSPDFEFKSYLEKIRHQ